MTLRELLTGALLQLDRNTDSQTMELWRDKLTRYINDAMIDLANDVRPRRTDPVTVENHTVRIDRLPRTCIKVQALRRDGVRYPFYYGSQTGYICVPGLSDGEAELTYRYLPNELVSDTDVPELPEWCHSALIAYVVGRERASGDAMSIEAARACFEIYNSIRRRMRASCGEKDAYSIINCC